MGNQTHLHSYSVPEGEEINKNRFEFIHIIGKGGFGKVWKVKDKKYKIEFALKEMAKVKVIDKKSEKSIKAEREFLQKLKHPFIVNMHSAFQDHHNLYLVMDLLNGGDLRYHLSKRRRFTEEQTTCIMIGLEYIHSKKIIHRDIKPENLVVDDNGYVHITDFGIAKYYNLNNSNETSGTPGYMSPEVMRAMNHSYSVDFFAVGVIGFEFMTGKRPYLGKSRKEIKEQIMAKQIEIKLSTLPEGWSKEAGDFINRLIQRKPENRLGHKNIKEIFEHPWLSNFPFQALLNKQLEAPYIPEKKDNFDKKYCEGLDNNGLETLTRYNHIMEGTNYANLFEKFTYYGRDNDEEYTSNSINHKTNYYNSFMNKHHTIASSSSNKKRCQSAKGNDIKIIETFSSDFYSNNTITIAPNKEQHSHNQVIKKRNASHFIGAGGSYQKNKIPCPSSASKLNNAMNSFSTQSFQSTSGLKTHIKKYEGRSKEKDSKENKAQSLTKNKRMNSDSVFLHARTGSIANASSTSNTSNATNANNSLQRSNSNLGEMTRGATIVTRNTQNNMVPNTLSMNTPVSSSNINNKITKRNKITFTSVTSLSSNSLNNNNTSTLNAQHINHTNTNTNANSNTNHTTTNTNHITTKMCGKKQAISRSSNSFLTIKINQVNFLNGNNTNPQSNSNNKFNK